ncbi:MAG: hypothetical protein ABIU29_10355 [Chthoniobacterales bacterium]
MNGFCQSRASSNYAKKTFPKKACFIHEAFAGIAVNTAVTWDATAGKDPDYDVLGKIEASGDDRGIGSNVAIYGSTAWRKRSLAHRAQNTAGGFASASMTPSQLSELLGLDKVIISRERYQSTATGTMAIIAFRTSTGLTLGTDSLLNATHALRAFAQGGSNADSTTGIPIDTDVYLWFEYVQGTGATRSCALAGARGIKPDLSVTSGQAAV